MQRGLRGNDLENKKKGRNLPSGRNGKRNRKSGKQIQKETYWSREGKARLVCNKTRTAQVWSEGKNVEDDQPAICPEVGLKLRGVRRTHSKRG